MRTVDTREPWELREILIATGWEQSALQFGDMAFSSVDTKMIGATRKTMTDLISSMDETLNKQLEEMLEAYDFCIFFVENDNNVQYNPATDEMQIVLHDKVIIRNRLSIVNYLHRWYAKGFISERTKNLAHTATRLNEVYTLYQKPYSKSANSRQYADDRILALPSGLRGKNGEKLLADRSLAEISAMSIPELESLNGIGSKSAVRVYNHFHRR